MASTGRRLRRCVHLRPRPPIVFHRSPLLNKTGSPSGIRVCSHNEHHGDSPPLKNVSPEIRIARLGAPLPAAIFTSGIQRRLSLSFEDGNVAILAGTSYFLVHRGFLSRQSEHFAELTKDVHACLTMTLEGRPVLHLPDFPYSGGSGSSVANRGRVHAGLKVR
jgi:hypothetical protein